MFHPDVVCIGSATVDRFLTIAQPFRSIRAGDKLLATAQEIHSGGGASNAAAALAKLGLKSSVIAKVGDDHDGDFVLHELKEYGIRNCCVHRSRHPTDAAVIISSTKERDRIIFVHKGASLDLHGRDFRRSELNARWIYLTSLMGSSMQSAREIARYAAEKKIPLLFNPSLYLAQKGKKFLKPILRAATILVMNLEEAQAVAGIKKEGELLLHSLHGLGPGTVVVTDGAKKVMALHHHRMYTLIPPNVRIVHTAGAGDAFTAGLLAGLIKGYSFADALRLGQANASSVIQRIGTKNGLLSEREAQATMRKLKIDVKEREIG